MRSETVRLGLRLGIEIANCGAAFDGSSASGHGIGPRSSTDGHQIERIRMGGLDREIFETNPRKVVLSGDSAAHDDRETREEPFDAAARNPPS